MMCRKMSIEIQTIIEIDAITILSTIRKTYDKFLNRFIFFLFSILNYVISNNSRKHTLLHLISKDRIQINQNDQHFHHHVLIVAILFFERALIAVDVFCFRFFHSSIASCL